MREILFRGKIHETEFQNIPNGWGEQDGDWIEGLYYIRTECVCGGYEYCECDGFEQHIISDSGKGDYPIDPETLGQYTGLKDKNGKMIFEGDIIRHHNKNFEKDNFLICYAGYSFYSKYVPYKIEGMVKDPLNAPSLYEVIGSIHDNPELFEEQK